MNLLIITTVIAVASAAQLPSRSPSNSYLPASQGGGFQGSQSNFGGGGAGGQFHGAGGSGSQNNFGGQFHGAGGSSGSGGSGGFGGFGNGNTRPQQAAEKNAAILKQDQDINDNGFHYSYETSNGIRAEESGNERQTQGGFAYKGDDGRTYSIVFTAGEGGFRPQGDHLPVAPPTPEAILQALEQNAKDEAAGIFDDGQYRPDSKGQGQGGFASGHGFGSANHQGSFNANSGYRY